MKTIHLVLCMSLLLTACIDVQMHDEEAQQFIDSTMDSVRKGMDESVNFGEGMVDFAKDTADSFTEEAVKPANSGKKTDENVKTKEAMLEEAGGQMIDEMRGSSIDGF